MEASKHTISEVVVTSVRGSTCRRVRLHQHTTVGRAEDNDLCFPDELLSRHHAEFRQRDGACYLLDLDSSNGTYVNDIRVRGEQVLLEGDIDALVIDAGHVGDEHDLIVALEDVDRRANLWATARALGLSQGANVVMLKLHTHDSSSTKKSLVD